MQCRHTHCVGSHKFIIIATLCRTFQILIHAACGYLWSPPFCFCPCYLGCRRTESGLCKLCSCDQNVTSIVCFKACVMDLLLNVITAPISVRCKKVWHVPVCNKFQTLPTVTEQHLHLNSVSFSHSCFARLQKSHWHLPLRNNLPSHLYLFSGLVVPYWWKRTQTKLLILNLITSRQ